MIENTTNLTNTTSCVGVWRGFLLFLSDYWQELSALAAIITTISVVIGLFLRWHLQKKQHIHEKEMEKLRQDYDKKDTSKVFLSEVKANQNLLQPLSDSLAKMRDSNSELSEEDKLPNELSFDRTIYSALSDKIGLFDNKCRDKLVQHYVAIKNIEEQYKKSELMHGLPLGNLLGSELKENTGRSNYNSNSPMWDEIENFLRYTEKVYNLGKELIKCLNGKIKQ